MNYEPVFAGTQNNEYAGTKAYSNTGTHANNVSEPAKEYILLLFWKPNPPFTTTKKKKKSSQEEDDVHEKPNGGKEGGVKPSDGDKLVNEEPHTIEQVSDYGSENVAK